MALPKHEYVLNVHRHHETKVLVFHKNYKHQPSNIILKHHSLESNQKKQMSTGLTSNQDKLKRENKVQEV